MEQKELTALIGRTAALMEQFERRCEALEQRQHGLSESLQALTRQMPGIVRQAADENLQRLPGAVTGNVRAGLEQPIAAYEQRLREAGQRLHSGSHSLATNLERMERLHRQLVWKVFAAVASCLVLLLAGGIALSMHYRTEIRENQLAADLLRAYNHADVTLCGGRLCANVDLSAEKFGPDGRYAPVRPR